MRTQAEGIKAQLLSLSDGHMLFRKVRKFKLPSSNTFRVIAKKNDRGGGQPPPWIDRCRLFLIYL